MKKLIYRAFGGLDVLELADVAVPPPGAGEVLVRVMAAAINPVDWKMRQGHVKVLSGWRMPQGQGLEFAGVVERVGRGVTEYTPGDEVFGLGKHCIADFCVAKVGRIAAKPAALSFAVASTIPCVGSTAISALNRAPVRAGMEVLVNGATGGIGAFICQMAVKRGANVTAVVSDKGIGLPERWGASRVVNYRSTNILLEGRRYDTIFELSDKLAFDVAKPILAPSSTFVASAPNPAELIPGLLSNLVSRRKYALMGMSATPDTLRLVASEVAAGAIEVLIGQTAALDDFREAYARAASGMPLGKSVFVMNNHGEIR